MTTARSVSQAVVLFGAIAGFLFGQVFSGVFSVAGTLAGIGGVLAGGLATFTSRPAVKRIVLAGCALGLLGAALDVYDYYGRPQRAGNYYPWVLTGPFAAGLALIAYQATRRPKVAVRSAGG